MPIYSYRCDKCGETFDKLVKPGGNGSVPCVHCKSDTSRVFSPVGIIFKGSGFYSTDYKSGKNSLNSPSVKEGGEKSQDQKGSDQKSQSGQAPKEKAAEKIKSAK